MERDMRTILKSMRLTRKLENGALITAGAVIAVILANRVRYNKGFTYKKLLKDNDICSLVTNIETLIMTSPHTYEMMFDPNEHKWYFTVIEGKK